MLNSAVNNPLVTALCGAASLCAGSSAALTGVRVQIYALDGSSLTSATTGAAGGWSLLQNLPTGAYLAVTRNSFGYIDEMWHDMPCPGGYPTSCGGTTFATPLNVTDGTVTSGIDFLDKGGQIGGKVTDAATTTGLGSEVDIYTEDGRSLEYASTDGVGNYTTRTGLPKGRYRVVQVRGPGRTKFYKALLLDYPNAEDRARYAWGRRTGQVPRRPSE